MRIAVCDVDAAYLHYIERLLRQIHILDTATIVFCTDPSWLLADVDNHEDAFDILIVNRRLGENDGVAAAARVVAADPWCRVIFLSDTHYIYPDFFRVRHSFILAKDLVPLFLTEAVEKAVRELDGAEQDLLTVTSNYTKLLLPACEVLYLERVLRKTRIVMTRDTVESSSSPQKILGDRLGDTFFQCHRSFFVNLRKVRGFQSGAFLLPGELSVPIGNTFLEDAEKAFGALSEALLSGLGHQ